MDNFDIKTISVYYKLATGPAFDYVEKALQKFDDGPFFLGQFSLVCSENGLCFSSINHLSCV